MRGCYSDLSLPVQAGQNDTGVRDRVLRAFTLGYSMVAVDVWLEQNQSAKSPKAKRAKKEDKECPSPVTVTLSESDVRHFSLSLGRKPEILTRLTIQCQDCSFLAKMKESEAIGQYDILAICPQSAQTLQELLDSQFAFDLVAVSAEQCEDLEWTSSLYEACLKAGLHLELPYSPLIRDASLRRKIIALSHHYRHYGESENVIFSSQAENTLEMRSPLDVANLACLLGIKEEKGQKAVRKYPSSVLKHARERRNKKSGSE